MEVNHKTKDLDSIISKIHHQDLEEGLEEEIQEDCQEGVIQEDHQEEEATQETTIIITQEDWI